MIYNIDYNICALVVEFLIFFWVIERKRVVNLQNRIFAGLVGVTICATIADILSVIALSSVIQVSFTIQGLIDTFYLIFYNLIFYIFLIYSIAVTGTEKNVPIGSMRLLQFLCLLVCSL